MRAEPAERTATANEKFWFEVFQEAPENPSLDLFFIFQGPSIDPVRLSRSFEQAIERHEALSTEFVMTSSGEVRARLSDTANFVWNDWGILPEADFASRLLEYRFHTIDPTAAPLFEFAFARVDGSDRVVCRISHSIADGAAGSLLLNEILQHYSGMPLAPSPRTKLGDYSRGHLEDCETAAMGHVETLSKLPKSGPLPVRGGDPEAPPWLAICPGNFEIPRGSVRAIRKIARRRKASMAAQLAAYFGLAIAVHNNTPSICCRTLFHGRRNRCSRNLVGFLACPGCIYATIAVDGGLDTLTGDLSKSLRQAHKASSIPLYYYLNRPELKDRLPRLEFNFIQPGQTDPLGHSSLGIQPLLDYDAIPALWCHPRLPTDLIVYNQGRCDGTVSVNIIGPRRLWGEDALKRFSREYQSIILGDVSSLIRRAPEPV